MELPFYHHIKSFFVSDNFLFVLMSNLAFVVVHGVFFLWCFPERVVIVRKVSVFLDVLWLGREHTFVSASLFVCTCLCFWIASL